MPGARRRGACGRWRPRRCAGRPLWREEHRKETGALLLAWVRAGHPLVEEPYLADLFARIAATGMRSGEFRERVAPEHAGNAVRDLCLDALYRWYGRPDGSTGTLTKGLLAALDPMLRGLVSAPPSEDPAH
ncbi:hypothetical protein [Streptomyces sp. NPDC003393]